jgi:hypothetical protein
MAKNKEVKSKSPKVKKPRPLPDLVPAKRTTQSKALAQLKWKLKPIRTRGVCSKQGCNIKWTGAPGRVFCKKHKKVLRKLQLKLNNVVWLKRVKAGTAGHHVIYKNHVTEFAAKKPKEALKKVEQGKATVDVPTFKKILKTAPKVKAVSKPEAKPAPKKVVEKAVKKAVKKLIKDVTKAGIIEKPKKAKKVKEVPAPLPSPEPQLDLIPDAD